MMFGGHLLSVLIWLPIIGGFVVMGLGMRLEAVKWLSLGISVLTFLIVTPEGNVLIDSTYERNVPVIEKSVVRREPLE